MTIFSFQHQPANKTDLAHSFGTFVRATSDGPTLDPQHCRLEILTISWLPAKLDVHCKRLFSEPGVNLDLVNTLQWGYERRLTLSSWGPYQIRKELYDEAVAKKALLESGCVRYKGIDSACRTDQVSNCIHTLTDLTLQTGKRRLGTPCWGEAASYFIVTAAVPWLIHPEQTHDWLMPRLELAHLPMVRRLLQDGNPNPKQFQRRLQDTLHEYLIEKRQR